MKPDWNVESEVALSRLPEEGAVVERPPTREARSPGEWLRENLFSTPFNGVLTVLVALLTGYLLFRVLRWGIVTAEWEVVRRNFRLFMVGRFPLEQVWRIWVSLYVVALLAGLSWASIGRRLRWDGLRRWRRAVISVLVVGLYFYLVDSPLVWALTAGAIAALLIGVFSGRAVPRRALRRIVRVGWLVAFAFVILILQVAGGVSPLRWGGLLLNILVAVVGIVLSFPIGILLALGRRSSFPAMRLVSVGFIEVIRGAPLFAWLIFGQFLLPFLLPPGLRLPEIVRAMIMFTIFSAAYVAEIVRGGLQGVHFGQYEAGRALGLSTTKLTALIVLPQALRNTIPAMISHFISLFKDTSLLAVIAFVEVLRVARVASSAAQFVGTSKQTLLFAALIFWIVAFSMSRWSQRLEQRLGVGER
ncbi:MAG TPA: amino acid ABC transporter permease [Actinomycetota bacterium]|nr:amino acid ABC transporter permease [Actinomycetota bacterium]